MDTDNPNHIQKNWSPFFYKDISSSSSSSSSPSSSSSINKLYFVKSIHPLLIVEMTNYTVSYNINDEDNQHVPCRQVSLHTCPNLLWSYGELRGGTQAELINGEYLSFFHSRIRLPNQKLILFTYFMGAYTFSATYPFQLKKISAFPIMDYSLYSGIYSTITTVTTTTTATISTTTNINITTFITILLLQLLL